MAVITHTVTQCGAVNITIQYDTIHNNTHVLRNMRVSLCLYIHMHVTVSSVAVVKMYMWFSVYIHLHVV